MAHNFVKALPGGNGWTAGGYNFTVTDAGVFQFGLPDNAPQSLVLSSGSKTLVIAASDETSALIAGTGKLTFRAPYAMMLSEVRASVNTAPTGSTLIVDINLGGVSILSTKLSIDAGEKTSTTAATAAVISNSSITNDGEITIDIDQIGATIAGAGLKITLIGA